MRPLLRLWPAIIAKTEDKVLARVVRGYPIDDAE